MEAVYSMFRNEQQLNLYETEFGLNENTFLIGMFLAHEYGIKRNVT
jgi:hypothetical protein